MGDRIPAPAAWSRLVARAPGVLVAVLLAALAAGGCGGGGEKLPTGQLPGGPATLRVTSGAFAQNGTIPRRYTCDGSGTEPTVGVTGVPAAAKELVLVVSDPDAPGGRFVPVTRFGISPRAGTVKDGTEGENSKGTTGWTPPCPPKGDPPHRYEWSVYALREPSGLAAGAKPAAVADAIAGGDEIVAAGVLTGRYGR